MQRDTIFLLLAIDSSELRLEHGDEICHANISIGGLGLPLLCLRCFGGCVRPIIAKGPRLVCR